jgi:hypothetical protein
MSFLEATNQQPPAILLQFALTNCFMFVYALYQLMILFVLVWCRGYEDYSWPGLFATHTSNVLDDDILMLLQLQILYCLSRCA